MSIFTTSFRYPQELVKFIPKLLSIVSSLHCQATQQVSWASSYAILGVYFNRTPTMKIFGYMPAVPSNLSSRKSQVKEEIFGFATNVFRASSQSKKATTEMENIQFGKNLYTTLELDTITRNAFTFSSMVLQ